MPHKLQYHSCNPSLTSPVTKMKFNRRVVILILSILGFLSGRIEGGPAPNQSAKISAANNDFSLDLYQAVKKDGENLVCSPLSLSIVLSMLLEGAPETSTTYQEIKKTLRYDDLSLSDIETGYKALFKSLKSGKDYTLNLADSIWIKDTFKVQDAFIQKGKDVFKADIESFQTANGADKINKWVADHTMNKITNLLGKLDDSILMVLVNAIYFKGSWVHRFYEENNVQGDFQSNDNAQTKATVTFMQLQDDFDYFDSAALNAQVLKLDYVGNDVSFVVILPKESYTLAELENSMKTSDIQAAICSATSHLVSIKLPKFTVESTLPLNQPLQQLGINEAFTDKADFSNITGTGPSIQVSTVVQKAIIEVSENGTVAAAATAIGVGTAAGTNEEPIEFTADHPFIYALIHNPTSSVIFIGRYTSPK